MTFFEAKLDQPIHWKRMFDNIYPRQIDHKINRITAPRLPQISYPWELVKLGTNKGRTLFIGNVDYAKERTLEEIDGKLIGELFFPPNTLRHTMWADDDQHTFLLAGYLRSLFEPFGEVVSVSVSDNKQVNDENDDAAEEQHSEEDKNSCSETRFAHLVFTKKASIKTVLAFTDTAFFDLTKSVAKVRQSIIEGGKRLMW